MPEFSDFIIFADESGDHGLVSIDPHFPVFVLAFCLFSKEAYLGEAVPNMRRFKFKHFGHDQIVLHEHDIVKNKGPFIILRDASVREPFLNDLSTLVANAPMTIVASVIDKEKYRKSYSAPVSPYHVSMGFGLERLLLHLNSLGCRRGVTHVPFEKRGPREDDEAELEFRRICDGHNATGRRFPFEIVMASKACNSSGLQLADLVARPIGRKVIKPEQPNRAYDVVHTKLRRNPANHSALGWGLKIFP
ncbi:MAG TPA: DUF3800 domain-containing protein [Longimicrobium sp.]|nr:DUF3800 domain-containing protein [Longimicrobium sp.]